MRSQPLLPVLLAVVVTAVAALAAPAAVGAGSMSMSPAIVQHTATKGNVGSVTIANTTGSTLTVSVVPRPWIQSAATGQVTADARHTLGAYLSTSTSSFKLAPGRNRVVTLTLKRVPSARSLYGAIVATGLPPKAKRGVTPGYRLIGSLRLDPPASARRIKLQASAPRTSGSGKARAIVLGVRNAGNTIDPISGSVTVSNASGTPRKVTLAGHRILPSGNVNLRLTSTAGLAKGTYTVKTTLRQAGRTVLVKSGRVTI